jgi:hypothetical protein
MVARGVTNPSVLINEERVKTPSRLKRLLLIWDTTRDLLLENPLPPQPMPKKLAKKKAKTRKP